MYDSRSVIRAHPAGASSLVAEVVTSSPAFPGEVDVRCSLGLLVSGVVNTMILSDHCERQEWHGCRSKCSRRMTAPRGFPPALESKQRVRLPADRLGASF